MLTVLYSGGGRYRGHNKLVPARERRGPFGRQRVNAALDPGEPAIDIAQQNAGGIGDGRANVAGAARASRERGGAGERLLTIGGHDWRSCRSAECGIAVAGPMLMDKSSAASHILAGTPRYGLD